METSSITAIEQVLGAVLLTVIFSTPAWVAIFVLRRRETTGAYSEMMDTISEMSVQLRQMQRDRERDHAQILRLQQLAGELTAGIKILVRQLERLNEKPEFSVNVAELQRMVEGLPAPEAALDLASLARKLARRFDIEELSDLAFQLNIETGDLGTNTRTGRATAIVRYVDRRGEIDKLIEMCRRLRPNEEW